MTSSKISSKTIARIAAIQVLYQYKSKDQDKNLDLIMQQIIEFYQDNNLSTSVNKTIKLSISYFNILAKSTVHHLDIIDQIISKYLTSEWQINNLPILLLALLRVAVGELQFLPNVPKKVVINEFTDIANEMLNNHEVGFVNSVLDKIAKIETTE